MAQANGAGNNAGALPDAVQDRLRMCGAASAAAYAFYKHNPIDKDFAGSDVAQLAKQLDAQYHDGKYDALAGFTGKALMWGYSGFESVITPPPTAGTMAPMITLIGFIAERPGADGVPELLFAFRGTQEKSDWITNILGAVGEDGVYKPAGRVHKGFYNMLSVAPTDAADKRYPTEAIKKVLESYQQGSPASVPPFRCICTGHSLGGALAVLAAAYTRSKHLPPTAAAADGTTGWGYDNYTTLPVQCYTFAAPRVGDAALQNTFSSLLQCPAVQLKNTNDPVPYLPPTGLSEAWTTVQHIMQFLQRTDATAGAASLYAAAYQAVKDAKTLEEAQARLLALKKQHRDSSSNEEEVQPAFADWIDKVEKLLKLMEDSLAAIGTAWADNAGAPSLIAYFEGSSGQASHDLQGYIANIPNATSSG